MICQKRRRGWVSNRHCFNGSLDLIFRFESQPHELAETIGRGKIVAPHFVFYLDKGFKPEHNVRTGRIFRNGRVWVDLDTLFTCETVSDARDVSQKRRT